MLSTKPLCTGVSVQQVRAGLVVDSAWGKGKANPSWVASLNWLQFALPLGPLLG